MSRSFSTPMRVEVVPHNPNWRDEFAAESNHIATVLGNNMVAIHHIGSTAIPTIYAKPIIDVLVAVRDIVCIDAQNDAMAAIAYEAMGEFGLPGRRYFRKHNAAGVRSHHVHIYQIGAPAITRHLAFRDYLLAHPDVAQQYSELKQQLAQQHPDDIESYMDGKDGLIKAIEQKALAWYSP